MMTAPMILRLEDRPLDWQIRGRLQTASGYGRKLTSARMVVVQDKGRETTRRVYVTIFSNAGTAWIVWHGRKWIVDEFAAAGDVLRQWGPD